MEFQKPGPSLGVELELVIYGIENVANDEFIPALASQMVTDPILVLLFEDGLRISSGHCNSPHSVRSSLSGAGQNFITPEAKASGEIGTEKVQDIKAPAAAFATSSRPPGL